MNPDWTLALLLANQERFSVSKEQCADFLQTLPIGSCIYIFTSRSSRIPIIFCVFENENKKVFSRRLSGEHFYSELPVNFNMKDQRIVARVGHEFVTVGVPWASPCLIVSDDPFKPPSFTCNTSEQSLKRAIESDPYMSTRQKTLVLSTDPPRRD